MGGGLLLAECGVVKAGQPHRRARNEMLAGAVLLALVPVLVHRSALDVDAVIFNALVRATQGVLMGVWLHRSAGTVFGGGATISGVLVAALCPKGRDVRRMGVARLGWGLLAMRSDRGARVVALRRLGAAWLMFPVAAGALGRFDYALFTAAAQHAGAATATVLFELWPLVMVLLVPAQRRFRAAVWVLAAAGVAMAVLGYSSEASGGGFWTGAALGLVAAFFAGCAIAADLAASGALHARYERRNDPQSADGTTGLPSQAVRLAQRRWLAVASALVAYAVVAPSSAAVALMVAWPPRLGIVATLGAVLVAATLLIYGANLRDVDSALNVSLCLSPVLGLGLLAAVGGIVPSNPLLFAAGAAAVLTANFAARKVHP